MRLKNNNIVIFSPQEWNDLFISKHHYAIELAKNNKVLFISGPSRFGFNKIIYRKPFDDLNLTVLDYSFCLPEWLRFHFKKLYKRIYTLFIKRIIKKYFNYIDLCIDFGFYYFFDSLDFIDVQNKIFFPVDDNEFLNKISSRGCKNIFTVSKVIQKKFENAGLSCKFINHGISSEFEILAKSPPELSNNKNIKIGYSGNLFIKFLNRDLFKYIVNKHSSIEFHLFGKFNRDLSEGNDIDWEYFLRNTPNIILHGLLTPKELANEFRKLDAFMICYKSDNFYYHSDNSHKILEYLSTGKVIISTYISFYEDTNLFIMSQKENDEEFKSNFELVVNNLNYFNSLELQKKRKEYALKFTYKKNIEFIFNSLSN